jgi:predicted Zn-dependent protease
MLLSETRIQTNQSDFLSKKYLQIIAVLVLKLIIITITATILSFAIFAIKADSSLAYSYEGKHWISDSASWPTHRIEINYSSLPKSWRISAYNARMEWNNRGRSNLYFYYSKTSNNTIKKGHYGRTGWLAITRIRTIGPYILNVNTLVNEDELWNAGSAKPMFWEHDLQSVLTHELGHWLCLDHSKYPFATMYSKNRSGSWSTRTLSQDDIEGIQQIYGKKESRR